MALKKKITSDVPIVIKRTGEQEKMYLPGFCYMTGEGPFAVIHTVIENVTKEKNSPMRRVVLSDGGVEIISVESIKKDLKEFDSKVLPIDKKYVQEEKEEDKKDE